MQFTVKISLAIFTVISDGRGVCGLVVAISGNSTYAFKDGTEQKIYAGHAALFSDKVAYIITNKNQQPFVHNTINFTLSPDASLKTDVLIKPVYFTDFSENVIIY